MAATGQPHTRSVSGARVFLSYSREDRVFARQIFLALQDMGFAPLMDVQAINPGEPWQERLTNLIDQCDTVVFVLTDRYLSSEACGWEIAESKRLDKRMIPVLPAPLADRPVPEELSRLQYVYFHSDPNIPDSGFYEGVRKLELAVRQDLDWLRQQRRYADRAEEWAASRTDDLLLQGVLLEEAAAWEKAAPEGEAIAAQVGEFLAASHALEKKKAARQKRFRIISVAALCLGVVLLAAAGGAGLLLARANDQLDASEAQLAGKEAEVESFASDTSTVQEVLPLWVRSRGWLESVAAAGESADASGTPPAVMAIGELRKVNDQLAALQGERFRALRTMVRRDLARALYYNSDAEAVTILDELVAEGGDGSSNQLLRLSEDLVSRAVYACLDPVRAASIAVDLAAAPEEAAMLMSWAIVAREDARAPVCEAAMAAVCPWAADCPAELKLRYGEPEIAYFEEKDAATPFPSPADAATGGGGGQGAPAPPPPPPPGPPPAPSDEKILDDPTAGEIPDRAPASAPATRSEQAAAMFQITEVYLHVPQDADRAKAETIAKGLQSRGIRVLGIETVKSEPGSNRSVRYYYAPQAAQAEELVALCEQLAAEAGFAAWSEGYRVMSLAGRYDGLPPNRVEIWF